MNYLLYGTEKFLVDKEIKNIINKHKIDDIDITRYDLEVNSIKGIIDEANTISLFSSNRLIIVENAFIFSKTTKKTDNIELLEEYLKTENKETIIIFVNLNEKIDSVKKITKLVKENGIIKEFNRSNNIHDNVKKMFDGYSIDYKTISLLISRVGNDLNILDKEIEKLKLYKIKEKLITSEDVINLTTKSIDTDIFKFIDNIINKNKKEAITTYKELLKLNEEPIKIISILANKFRLMYQASELTKKGYSEENISDILKVHKYPVSLAIQSGLKYDSEVLLNHLNSLANLDIKIKTGLVDKNLALELFILEL